MHNFNKPKFDFKAGFEHKNGHMQHSTIDASNEYAVSVTNSRT